MSDFGGDAQREVTTDVLVVALKLAAQAHRTWRITELGGLNDPYWPEWYADHMTRTLSDAGFGLMGRVGR
jgi:hypothetical protein